MSTKGEDAALELAREHLARAEEDPGDADSVFVWSFWGLESAILAAASHAGIALVKQHWSKEKAARRLFKDKGLPDVAGLLSDLNDGRKAAAYGDIDEPDLDPRDVLVQLRDYIDKVAEFLNT